MSIDASAKYHRNNTERPPKSLLKHVKVFLKKEKKKSNHMGAKNKKISVRWKTKTS